jgi:signal transduction histidine kinase/integral membrane sensor domain MASE1
MRLAVWSVASPLPRSATFAAVFALACVVGRMSVLDGGNLSLVWPAAGVAALWFWVQRDSPWRWLDVATLAAITLGVNLTTGASLFLATVFAVANIVQTLVFVHLLSRWRPALAAGRGPRLRGVADLWAVVGVSLISTVCGALIGPTGVWLATGTYSWWGTAVWAVRNTASVLLITVAGLHLSDVLRSRPPTVRTRPSPRVVGEYVAVLTCSAVAYVVVFGFTDGLPLAFPLLALTVWAALRLSTTFVLFHGMAAGVAVVLFTFHGTGPFGAITDLTARVLVAQVFVVLVAVVGLVLALGRDERLALLRELTEGKEEAARQAALLSAIVDSMGDGLSVVDEHHRVLLRNPAAVRLLGGRTSPDDTVTAARYYGFFRLDGEPVENDELPHSRALADGGVHEADMMVRNPGVPDGRILHMTASALSHAQQDRKAVVLFHDVTAQHRHRDELTNFAGVVAHDLLNPLTSVEAWTGIACQTIEAGPVEPELDVIETSLLRIGRASARMRTLITDLLTYTTSRETRLALAPVDLSEVVSEIAVAQVDAATAVGAPVPVFHIGSLPLVQADPVLIRQLLDNLLGNAIKYTAPGVVPRITVEAERVDNLVTIYVSDNGIGIPPGQHTAIFGTFHRAHRDSAYGGTGLGLAICKRIAERHGGTITACDNPGGGSRLAITFPGRLLTTTTDGTGTRLDDHAEAFPG